MTDVTTEIQIETAVTDLTDETLYRVIAHRLACGGGPRFLEAVMELARRAQRPDEELAVVIGELLSFLADGL